MYEYIPLLYVYGYGYLPDDALVNIEPRDPIYKYRYRYHKNKACEAMYSFSVGT